MVYALDYKSKGASSPRAQLIEGEGGVDGYVLEDESHDGGAYLWSNKYRSGRRVRTESLPRVIRRFAKKSSILDYETQFVDTVSDRFRNLIESIEPGVHQFEPVKFIGRDRELLEDRWIWQCCNRLASVSREYSVLNFSGFVWMPPKNGHYKIVFDTNAIGDHKFWCDMHRDVGILMTDECKNIICDSKITGVDFNYYQQV